MRRSRQADGRTASRRAAQPGPVYDNAVKLLAGRDLVAVCDRLGVDAGSGPQRLSEELPHGGSRTADLLARIGPGRLLHVEFVSHPRRRLAVRMLDYRVRILAAYPEDVVTQHVVVLARGTFVDDFADDPELDLRLHVTYLRDQDPQGFLAGPSLAPLAVLARARGRGERVENLRKALAVVAAEPDPHHRQDLVAVTATLAGIYLDTDTVTSLTREAGMPFTLDENTVAGRSIARKHYRRGREEGREEGREKGREEGAVRERERTLALLLRGRHGDDPRIDDVAHLLAALPRAEGLRLATTLDDLDHPLPQAP